MDGAVWDRMAAPLDLEAVRASVAPFGASRNLPRDAYTSAALLEWERRHFFGGGWVCAGRFDLREPGRQQAIRLDGHGILLVVGDDRILRGFHNVCRHRAHELLEPGAGAQAAVIRCPYHAWAYELDGRLKAAPRTGRNLDPVEHSLSPVRVSQWRGWTFVNLSGDAPPLTEWLGDLDRLIRDYEPERLSAAAQKTYTVAANWKLVHENYHECYHCPQIHPELCKVSPPQSGVNLDLPGAWIGGRMNLQSQAETMSLDGRSGGVRLRSLSGAQLRRVDYYGLLPNLFLSLHPDYVLTHRIEPEAADRTRIQCQWLFAPEALENPDFRPDYAVRFWDVTNLQDWKAVESVQRGISSQGYVPGPLAEKEDAVYDFVSRVAWGYLEGRLHCAAPPAQPLSRKQ